MRNGWLECCAYGCSKRYRTRQTFRSDSEGSDDDESIVKRKHPRTFHRFPKDAALRRQWVRNIRRKNWVPTVSSRICSDHFIEKYIIRQRVVRLRPGAVPTRFKGHPKYYQKKPTKQRRPIVRRSPVIHPSIPKVNFGTVQHDHSYTCKPTNNEVKDKLLHKIDAMKKQVKKMKQRNIRLRSKVKSSLEVISRLQNNHLISDNCVDFLKSKYGQLPANIFNSMLCNKRTAKYDKDVQAFALTLQFYSPKAYRFVRRALGLCLPHPAQIRKWYNNVPAEPRFTAIAFHAISHKVRSSNGPVFLSLILDEMSIRKHISWDGKMFRGFVDIAEGVQQGDSAPLAKEALVLMAVCINAAWKVPVAYFFVDGLTSREKASIVKDCVWRLSETGAKVISLTCDGLSCHLSMFQELGAKIDPDDTKPNFPHPAEKNSKVNIFLDACHMLKFLHRTVFAYDFWLTAFVVIHAHFFCIH